MVLTRSNKVYFNDATVENIRSLINATKAVTMIEKAALVPPPEKNYEICY
jgi:hypothetical protein